MATWIAYGTGHLSSNWSWRIPTIIQMFPSVLVISFVWFVPESPRWLMRHNKREKAHAVLVKYHGMGHEDSAVVELEMNEIEQTVNYDVETSDKRW